MLSLLELARKWLVRLPGVSDLSAEELGERDAFHRRASALWLEYHENQPWAQRKLQSGTVHLTPEALAYMEQEIESRAAYKAHEAAIKKQLENENAVPPENAAPHNGEPGGTEPGDAGRPGY